MIPTLTVPRRLPSAMSRRLVRALPGLLCLAGLLLLSTACRRQATPTDQTATAATAADGSEESEMNRPEWALAIHGGAGVIPKDMEEGRKREYSDALEAALTLGVESLEAGETALDTVEKIVRSLEDDPKFNAGKGAVYTHDGRHELDAAIMDGRTLNCGSVAAVTTIKHPITLARGVLEHSPHVFLIGEGAEVFATELGVERVTQDYYDTEHRRRQLERALEEEREEGPGGDQERSTVGAVALDRDGNLAAATSTGGLTNKRFGRVGDVPVIGAGTYANNRTCAISGTGKGEQFIRHTVAHSISAAMEYGGLSLEEAAHHVIDGLDPGDGGVIGVGHDGSIALVFNSAGMFRGAADSRGRFEVGIWEAPEIVSRP
jgi:beta-aspartyl-peptidase (threonine type)